jgi:hypothetical protein
MGGPARLDDLHQGQVGLVGTTIGILFAAAEIASGFGALFAGRAVRLGDAQRTMLGGTALSILLIAMTPLLGGAFAAAVPACPRLARRGDPAARPVSPGESGRAASAGRGRGPASASSADPPCGSSARKLLQSGKMPSQRHERMACLTFDACLMELR